MNYISRRIETKERIIREINRCLSENGNEYDIKCVGTFSKENKFPLVIPEFINAARDDVEDMLVIDYDFFNDKKTYLRSKVETLIFGSYALNDEEAQTVCEIIENIISNTLMNKSVKINNSFVFRIRIFDDITQPELRDTGGEKLFYSAIPCEVNIRYNETN